MRLPVDLEREVALEHVDDLRRPGSVRFGLVHVAGLEAPVPELDVVELVAAHQQPSAAPARRGPQLRHVVARDHPHAPLAPELDELREADVERLREAHQGGERGIDALLLDLDEHAAADARPLGELVERQPALAAQAPQVARQRIGGVFRAGHSSPPSLLVDPAAGLCSGRHSVYYSIPTKCRILHFTGGERWSIAGELTQEQTELLFAHLPIGLGFSVADEEDVVGFWAGDGFSTCSPKLIGRTLYGCHPKRAHAAIESLLADLKSGSKDEVDTIEHGKNGAERIIYTALRDADGAYRGVLETVVPIDDAGSANAITDSNSARTPVHPPAGPGEAAGQPWVKENPERLARS